jgi:hypothetical protein
LDYQKIPTTSGSKFTRIRHGPYSMYAVGMIGNRLILNVQKPFPNCYITALQASLEYADGTAANVDIGVRVSDTLTVVTRYNTTVHPPVPGHDGNPHPIMGISRVYIG